MSFLGAVETLNNLKKNSIIGDYAIGGGYAVNYYLEPTLTYALDILVLVDTDSDYYALYKYFRENKYKIENVYVVIDGLPVQLLPSTISPLYNEAIRLARKITVKGVPSKVVRVEHLIALLLVSYRPKDKIRVVELLKLANKSLLDEIIMRFEDEKAPLRQRLRGILANI